MRLNYSFLIQNTSEFCFTQALDHRAERPERSDFMNNGSLFSHYAAPGSRKPPYFAPGFFLFSGAGLIKVKILLNLSDHLLLTRLP
jgi:hypothetical protein